MIRYKQKKVKETQPVVVTEKKLVPILIIPAAHSESPRNRQAESVIMHDEELIIKFDTTKYKTPEDVCRCDYLSLSFESNGYMYSWDRLMKNFKVLTPTWDGFFYLQYIGCAANVKKIN